MDGIEDGVIAGIAETDGTMAGTMVGTTTLLLAIAGEAGEIIITLIAHHHIMETEVIIGDIMVTEITERITRQRQHLIQKVLITDLEEMAPVLHRRMVDQNQLDLKALKMVRQMLLLEIQHQVIEQG